MRDAVRLYLRCAGISVRSQMSYRASFVMISVGQLLGAAIEFAGILVLFQRFGGLRGWTLPEVALFYGIANVAFALAENLGRGFDVFPGMVRSGEFDRMLLRPRATALQVAAQECHVRVGRLLQGMAVLAWAATSLHGDWGPARAAAVCAAILTGACVFGALFIVQAAMAFWTVDGLEVMNALTYGGNETAQYPLTIYRAWFRRFFTFVVPLACMNYLPVGVVLRPGDPASPPMALALASPAAGVVFLCASLALWQAGVRRYTSTGS